MSILRAENLQKTFGGSSAGAASVAAAAAMFLAPALASAQGRYVHANNSPFDNLDPHAVFDVGRAASRINMYDGLYRWVDNPPKMIPWLALNKKKTRFHLE